VARSTEGLVELLRMVETYTKNVVGEGTTRPLPFLEGVRGIREEIERWSHNIQAGLSTLARARLAEMVTKAFNKDVNKHWENHKKSVAQQRRERDGGLAEKEGGRFVDLGGIGVPVFPATKNMLEQDTEFLAMDQLVAMSQGQANSATHMRAGQGGGAKRQKTGGGPSGGAAAAQGPRAPPPPPRGPRGTAPGMCFANQDFLAKRVTVDCLWGKDCRFKHG
jgi:hypothetical protein